MFKIAYGLNSVDLPNPEIGDSVNINLRMTVHFCMSSKPYTYKRTPALDTRIYTFLRVPVADINTFKQLLIDYKNKEYIFTSYDGSQFNGLILNEPTFTLHDYINCEEYYFDLELQS